MGKKEIRDAADDPIIFPPDLPESAKKQGGTQSARTSPFPNMRNMGSGGLERRPGQKNKK